LDDAVTTIERQDAQGRPVVHTARLEWIGEALTITTTTKSQWNYKTFEAYSLDAEGRLVVMWIETPLQRGSMLTKRLVYAPPPVAR
jgi:hypothetical protein